MKYPLPSRVALALLSVLPALTSAQACGVIDNVKITHYGWDDNSPPGPVNAFDCGRGKTADGSPIAGGTGTYDDPISYATASGNNKLKRCGIVYVPAVRKYFRNEDECQACSDDWKSQTYHIDLWTGSNEHEGGKPLIDCENSLQSGTLFINNAPAGLAVDPTPRYGDNGCYSKTYDVGDANSLCSGAIQDHGNSTSSRPAVQGNLVLNDAVTTLATAPMPAATGDGDGGRAGGGSPGGSTGCAWEGHCVGAPCTNENDCSEQLVCGADKTCVALSGARLMIRGRRSF